MVYINGQDWAVAAHHCPLSPAARATIAAHGPYTQDFARVYPILRPQRCEEFMDELLSDTSTLLGPLWRAHTAGGPVAASDFVQALLTRPNVDPGGPTYTTFMKPLLECDTKSYDDMRRIVEWAEDHIGGVPSVLLLCGDGQSVLRLRDLKRLHPDLYRHVLVGNGPFHSSAHFQFACCFLWDKALLHTCFVATNKRRWDSVNDRWEGTIPSAIVKNLEHNSTDHTLQANLAVVVAIYYFLICHVKHPPPQLLMDDPALYAAMVQNAGVRVLVQYLRHAGLPMLWWQRCTRSQDGLRLDSLHALAIHVYRCAHKTSSTQISLLHLISIFGTHPELRSFVRRRMFVSLLGGVGRSIGCDKSLEVQNDDQKERNTGLCVLNALHFGRLLQPLNWVNRMWRTAMGASAGQVDVGYRASIIQEVEVLYALFVRLIVTTDAQTPTDTIPTWHTGHVRRVGGSVRDGSQPDRFIWAVADGVSRGERGGQRPESWGFWFRRMITDHMFPY
jgi:hypothetical protein